MKAKAPKPTHYKVICISIYVVDLEALDDKVAALKRRGHTKTSRSSLIRLAVSTFDPSSIPVYGGET